MTARRRIVAGLGNELRADDGVGVHAVRALAATIGSCASCWEIGANIWHLAGLLQPGDHVLAIDAVSHHGVPGSICYVEGHSAACARRADGVHGLGLFEMLPLIEPARRPTHVAVLGVQPASLDYGMQLSPPVARALPVLVQFAQAWLAGTPLPTSAIQAAAATAPRHQTPAVRPASAWCRVNPHLAHE